MHLQTRDGSPVCVTHYITNSTHLQDSRRVTGMRNTLHHQQHTPRQVTGMCNTLHHHLYTTPCCLQVFLSFPYQLTLITDTRTSHYTVLHYSYRVSNKRIAWDFQIHIFLMFAGTCRLITDCSHNTDKCCYICTCNVGKSATTFWLAEIFLIL